MDPADHACMDRTLEHAPTGQTVAWRNPDNGTQYRVTPTQTYQGDGGRPCRVYTTQAVIDGKDQQVEGTACRQPDGSWKVASNDPNAGRSANTVSQDTVFRVQQRLREEGFYVRDNIDGRWGPRTSVAVQNYQRAKGLNPTGQLDPDTLAALNIQ
jgi:hypothetical protein